MDEWSKLCVTADNGVYKMYFNGKLVSIKTLDVKDYVVYSHSATTLGFVDEDYYDPFDGYMDDVSS